MYSDMWWLSPLTHPFPYQVLFGKHARTCVCVTIAQHSFMGLENFVELLFREMTASDLKMTVTKPERGELAHQPKKSEIQMSIFLFK